MGMKEGYLALCYHYIRSEKDIDRFPGIISNKASEFRSHIEFLAANYEILSPQEVLVFSCGDYSLNSGKCGLLFTFDDGLSDHYQAACILAERGIKGFFFVPTCIFSDGMPANPTIIHYCLAKYRIDGFLKVYREALEEFGLSHDEFNIAYEKGVDDPWETIAVIKSTFRYKLNYKNGRDILLQIHKSLLLKDYPEALKFMHLTEEQVREMLQMGHMIGHHSHSHISVAATDLDGKSFEKEMIEPRRYLEEKFNVPVYAFSYPFGLKKDCFCQEELVGRTSDYRLVFTIERIVNTKETHPLELGRYMVTSRDDTNRLDRALKSIINSKASLVCE